MLGIWMSNIIELNLSITPYQRDTNLSKIYWFYIERTIIFTVYYL